jgi:hypothetical protein
MFEFLKFAQGDGNSLTTEKRLPATSGYALYRGQALVATGGALFAAAVGDIVYAISNVSAASSVVTAGYIPDVFPVNESQVWKAPLSTAVTAAFLAGKLADIGSTVNGTAVRGDFVGTGMLVYSVSTADSPTSSVGVIFKYGI